jgi:hypothetical protein
MHTSTVMNVRPEPWYRHRWPWLLMAGPFTVLIAGAITMWISFSGADALVVDDYYKQGKAINQDLRRDRQAAAMGLSLSLRFDAVSGALIGQVRGLDQAATLNLSLIHPTMPDKDLKLLAVPDGQGQFSVALPMLERALWQVQLEDTARTWRLHGSWAWPQQKNTDIQAVSDTDQNARGGG